MIRVLRLSAWASPGSPPMTVVIRDHDAIDTLESVAAYTGDNREVSGFFLNDIFEMDDGTTIEQATLRAMSRIDEAEEQDMASLFFFVLGCLRLTQPDGLWAAPDPAPLTAKQIAVVFDQLRTHPARERQTLYSYSTEEDETHKLVTLDGNEITVDGEVV